MILNNYILQVVSQLQPSYFSVQLASYNVTKGCRYIASYYKATVCCVVFKKNVNLQLINSQLQHMTGQSSKTVNQMGCHCKWKTVAINRYSQLAILTYSLVYGSYSQSIHGQGYIQGAKMGMFAPPENGLAPEPCYLLTLLIIELTPVQDSADMLRLVYRCIFKSSARHFLQLHSQIAIVRIAS